MAVASADQIDQFLELIASKESGGNPNAVNKDSGAFGTYQIMPSNWTAWANDAGVDPSDRSADAQYRVARHKMLQLFNDLGSWQAVAVAWYAGEGAAKKWLNNPEDPQFTRPQGGGKYPSINEYSGDISRKMGDPAATTPGTVQPGQAPTPAAPTGDTTVVAAASDKNAPLPPNATAEQIDAWLRSNVPDVVPYLANPEIKMLAYYAAQHDLSDTEALSLLHRSQYWQTHSAPARAFDEFQATQGSAEVNRVVGLAEDAVSQAFHKNGLNPDAKTISDLAKNAIKSGYISLDGNVSDVEGLNRMVAFGLGAKEGSLPSGETSFNSQQLMAIAKSDYLFPISQREADQWAVKILAGSETEQSFRSEMSNRAKNLYPWLTPQIEAGGTVQSATDGIRNAIANTLEMDPDTIDLLDPRWNAPLKMWDSKSNTYRSMTEGEAAQWARNQPDYAKTQAYGQQTASIQRGLADFITGRKAA